MAQNNGLYTTPVYAWNVSLVGSDGTHAVAGSANYSGGTSGNNLILFAVPAGLKKETYAVSGYKVPGNTHIEFPSATLVGQEGNIAYFSTKGWEVIPG